MNPFTNWKTVRKGGRKLSKEQLELLWDEVQASNRTVGPWGKRVNLGTERSSKGDSRPSRRSK